MIQAAFQLGQTIITAEVNGEGLLFKDITNANIIAPQFGYNNVIKEFPDLKDDPLWKTKAEQRFIDYFHTIKGEMEKIIYIAQELKKVGYKPMYWMKKGFRTQKFDNKDMTREIRRAQ
jgi:hypothetical protein